MDRGIPTDEPLAWNEAIDGEELVPGDLGAGTQDLEHAGWSHPRRARRIPVSFSAVVLLLTLTIGMGMAAGLLAGPSPFHIPGAPTTGTGGHGLGGPNGTRSPNGTAPGSNQTINRSGPGSNSSQPGHNTTSPHSKPPGNTSTTPGNSTGNKTPPTHSGPNSTQGPGNSTDPNATGNSSSSSSKHSALNRSVSILRVTLPWLPTDPGTWILVGAAISLSGLAAAMLLESVRPPPDEKNPWKGEARVGHKLRRHRPPPSPRGALEEAIRALRAELFRYDANHPAVDTDVRERVIQLYGTLLAAVSPGLGDLAGRTPREVEWLSVQYLGVGSETAHELTWLFEEARYSSHRMPPAVVDRAQHALTLLATDLERRSWAL